MSERGDDKPIAAKEPVAPTQVATPAVPHMPVYMSAIYIAASVLMWSTRGLSMYFLSLIHI